MQHGIIAVMTTVWFYAIGSVLVVSLISLIGIFTLSFREQHLRKLVFVLVSVSVGALFGDTFIHLIPEALEGAPGSIFIPLSILSGILLFFLLEKFLQWRHSHGEAEECRDTEKAHDHGVKPLGAMVIFSDAIHNVVDGVIIGVGYLVSIEVGIATTVAIILHEIPHEIADFGLLLHSGIKKYKALFYNFISALTAVFGTIVALLLGESVEAFIPFALAFAAGSFVYIAGSDLVPELHKVRGPFQSLLQVGAILFGILLMYALILLE